MSDAPAPGHGERTELARDLSLLDVTMIGVGAMIGAGIFVLTGLAAGEAGPALVMAFALNGLITIFTAMVYAELGSAIPEAGGGYLWVREALGRSQAFLAGWMSWFAHAVAGSLYALGFGAFITLLTTEYFGLTFFGVPHPVLEKAFAVAAAAAFAYINYRGAKETGLAGNVVTLLKVTVILVFVAAGLGAMFGEPNLAADFEPFAPNGLGGVFVAMGLTFIAFEGYEIIVQSGEEVVSPRENVPKAVFYSMAIVVTIYILVAIVLLGAVDLTPELLAVATDHAGALPENPALWQVLGHLGELGLARAADQVLPYGTLIILVAGVFSTLSALNATTFSSTRVGFAMGRDGVLPDALRRVHATTRTPYVSVAATGALVAFMAVALPIHAVAAAADVMFLLLFLQVNYAAIKIRRKWGHELDYGYLTPWFPLAPVVGILTLLFLAVFLFTYSPVAWYGAVAWIVAGLGIFAAYSYPKLRGAQAREETRLITEQRAPTERAYKILVPIANAANAERLVRIAARVARERDGEIHLTTVVKVPSQTPLSEGHRLITDEPELLREAQRHVPDDIPSHWTVTIGHDVGKSINNIAYQRGVDLVLLGWRGQRKRFSELVLGEVIDRVVEEAPSNVCVVKLGGAGEPKHVLLPSAGGPHAEMAEAFARALLASGQARLTLFRVAHNGTEGAEAALDEWRAEFPKDARVDTAVARSEKVAPAILEYAREHGVDAIIMGAAEEGLVRQVVFGAIPEDVAGQFEGEVLMVRRHRPVVNVVREWAQRYFGGHRRGAAPRGR